MYRKDLKLLNPKLMVTKSKKPSCPKSHELTSSTTSNLMFGCNVCQKSPLPLGSQIYGCRVCNWDCCDQCWKNGWDKKQQQIKTSYHIDFFSKFKLDEKGTSWNLNHKRIGKKECIGIGFFLIENTSLTHLDLGGNGLEDSAISSLSPGLKMNAKLVTLLLDRNMCSEIGADFISNALKDNFSLTLL